MTFEAGKTYERGNTGHGHVYPRPDGYLARCGGPHMCAECARDCVAMYMPAAPKPEPRRVWLYITDSPDDLTRLTECLIGPDGALRVAGE